jgi:N-dimethylarginine dimethylaminohydrolase
MTPQKSEKPPSAPATGTGTAKHAPAGAPPPLREKFVMCPPRYLSTKIKNNVWMKREPVDVPRAMRQYHRIKTVIQAFGIDVLEIPPVKTAQDQTYVANIGVAIDPYIILANYKAPGRGVEVGPARAFFEAMGYHTLQPPFHFEGEADLKKCTDTLYFGGFGQFTDLRAHRWIEERTGITIVSLKEVNEQLYHLDTSVFVIDDGHVLVTKAGLDKASLTLLGGHVELIETPADIASTGITNGVKIPQERIYLSGTFQPETKDYQKAMEWLLETFDKFGYTVVLLDTDEADKSGADLSCMVFHLDFDVRW